MILCLDPAGREGDYNALFVPAAVNAEAGVIGTLAYAFQILVATLVAHLGGGAGGTGGTAGMGGEGGTGGSAASMVCEACDVAEQIGECEATYNTCIIDDAGTPEDCAAAALLRCRGV